MPRDWGSFWTSGLMQKTQQSAWEKEGSRRADLRSAVAGQSSFLRGAKGERNILEFYYVRETWRQSFLKHAAR